jgi:hypothetical protein
LNGRWKVSWRRRLSSQQKKNSLLKEKVLLNSVEVPELADRPITPIMNIIPLLEEAHLVEAWEAPKNKKSRGKISNNSTTLTKLHYKRLWKLLSTFINRKMYSLIICFFKTMKPPMISFLNSNKKTKPIVNFTFYS